jgi:hypothetical protein
MSRAVAVMSPKPVVKTTIYIKNGAKAHDRRRHNGDVLYFANTIPQTPSRTVETSRTRDAHHFQFSIFN